MKHNIMHVCERMIRGRQSRLSTLDGVCHEPSQRASPAQQPVADLAGTRMRRAMQAVWAPMWQKGR